MEENNNEGLGILAQIKNAKEVKVDNSFNADFIEGFEEVLNSKDATELKYPSDAKFKLGEHIQDSKGNHGIVEITPFLNYWGYIYCVNMKNKIGKCCIQESEASIYNEK